MGKAKAKGASVAEAQGRETPNPRDRKVISKDTGYRIAGLNHASQALGQRRLSPGIDLGLIARNMACYSD